MASRLKEGGGQLGTSKTQGWGLPAPAKAKPLPPPSSVAAKAKAKAATTEDVGEVRLWLSRLPMEPTVENQELLDCLNKLISDAGIEGHAEIDPRRDSAKDWVYINVASQDVA